MRKKQPINTSIPHERALSDLLTADNEHVRAEALTELTKDLPAATQAHVKDILQGYTKPLLTVRAKATKRIKHVIQVPNLDKSERITNILNGLTFYVANIELLFEPKNYSPPALSKAFQEKFESILPLISDGLIIINGNDIKIRDLSETIDKMSSWDTQKARATLDRIKNAIEYIKKHQQSPL